MATTAPALHSLRRTAAAAAIATSLFTLGPSVGAHAAPATEKPLAWASYTQAPAWLASTDNVQWYVASPTITNAMVNRPITLTATSPTSVDCKALGAGYHTSTGWVNLDTSSATCTPTSVSWTFVPTRDMVGTNVFLNGWSAVADPTATITGTYTLGRSSATNSSTATRPARTACSGAEPTSPAAYTYEYGTRTANLYSLDGQNEVWFEGTCYPGPSGTLLDDSAVRYAGPLAFFTYAVIDPTTGVVTRWSMNVSSPTQPAPTTTGQSGPYPGEFWAYRILGYHGPTTVVRLVPLDGSTSRTLYFPGWTNVSDVTTDGKTATITYSNFQTGQDQLTCTATLTTSTCPGTVA